MEKRTDQQLLQRAKDGDRDALGELLSRHASELRHLLGARVHSGMQQFISIDELIQEIFLVAFLKFKDFDPQQPLAAWLTGIATNILLESLSYWRAKKRNPARLAPAPTDGSRASYLENLVLSLTTASRTLAKTEAEGFVHAALDQLPPVWREAVVLCDLEAQPVPEVAARLACSEGAVYMRRSRGRERLKEILAADFSSQIRPDKNP